LWVIQNEDINLPKWLTDELSGYCDCGSPIENEYNHRNEITSSRCTNKQCPYVMAQKIKSMCKDILGMKGIGATTALNLVKEKSLSCHFDAIPILCKEKPRVSLYNLLRMCFIEGIDTGWKNVVEDNETVDELFSKYQGKYRRVLLYNEELIRKGEKVFSLIQRNKFELDAVVTGTVMISGNIRGFNERNDFIRSINYASRGSIRIAVSESKRKTGIMALIQEKDTPNRGKAQTALACGIPIMSPSEFMLHVCGLLRSKQKGGV